MFSCKMAVILFPRFHFYPLRVFGFRSERRLHMELMDASILLPIAWKMDTSWWASRAAIWNWIIMVLWSDPNLDFTEVYKIQLRCKLSQLESLICVLERMIHAFMMKMAISTFLYMRIWPRSDRHSIETNRFNHF